MGNIVVSALAGQQLPDATTTSTARSPGSSGTEGRSAAAAPASAHAASARTDSSTPPLAPQWNSSPTGPHGRQGHHLLTENAAAEVASLATTAAERFCGRRLIPKSLWGFVHRRQLRSGAWCDARFLTRTGLRAVGAAHRRIQVQAALYTPGAIAGLSPSLRSSRRSVRGTAAWRVFESSPSTRSTRDRDHAASARSSAPESASLRARPSRTEPCPKTRAGTRLCGSTKRREGAAPR